MNRRKFLECLGVFAAGAVLPAWASERIIRAPDWYKGAVTVYRSAVPLEAGHYTFTALAGDLGMYFGGVTATGGECLFEIPGTHIMKDARLKLGAIHYPLVLPETTLTVVELAAAERGQKVTKA